MCGGFGLKISTRLENNVRNLDEMALIYEPISLPVSVRLRVKFRDSGSASGSASICPFGSVSCSASVCTCGSGCVGFCISFSISVNIRIRVRLMSGFGFGFDSRFGLGLEVGKVRLGGRLQISGDRDLVYKAKNKRKTQSMAGVWLHKG